MAWSQVLWLGASGLLTGISMLLNPHGVGIFSYEMGDGSYLIWAIPEQGVFIDPRVELYPYEMWQDYIRIMKGTRYNQLLEKYAANRALIDRYLQPELSRAVSEDPGWILEYEDEHSQIWLRAND